MNPFDYVGAINQSKKDLMVDDIAEKDYSSFLVNRSLSYFLDTVMVANEMNINHHIDSRLQFIFLINSVRKRKRFSKWHKAAATSDDVNVIKQIYNYNDHRAHEALKLLSRGQINALRERVNTGGKQ